jgi:hypothetical protein
MKNIVRLDLSIMIILLFSQKVIKLIIGGNDIFLQGMLVFIKLIGDNSVFSYFLVQ